MYHLITWLWSFFVEPVEDALDDTNDFNYSL